MKRSSDSQQQSYQSTDSNKKPRYTQSNYGDVYAQYGMMSQYGAANPFTQTAAAAAAAAAAGPYGGYGGQSASSMYGMGYGNPQSLMASQYGAAYPQAFPAAAAGYPGAGNMMGGEVSRTIYLGNVSADMEPNDILKHVSTGALDSFRAVPEKNCAFLTFVEPLGAQMFYQEYLTKKLIVNDVEIRIGWGKAHPISSGFKIQIQAGASRNVYLGRLDENDTEESIREALSQFGPIEQIKLMREKNIAFVHFLSINAASQCISMLSNDPAWRGKRINYGKDHCASRVDPYNSSGYSNPYGAAGSFAFDPYGMSPGYALQANTGTTQRTLYIGNIHPEATCEDICNSIRGGNLLQIRYFPEKHISFVTFMDPETAMAVFNHAATVGICIKGRKVKVGWGKPSSIPAQVAIAVQNGATRNIYIGGISDSVTVEKLREDFAEYGEIELVNLFKEKNCAFVNFTSVINAIAALANIKSKSDYSGLKINYGKDRCGNPWRVIKKTKGAHDGKEGEDKDAKHEASSN